MGSSSIGRRIRGPNNRRTRLASRRMSIPSRQQQTYHEAYCSSRIFEIARACERLRTKKILRENNLLFIVLIGKTHVAHELFVMLAVRANGVCGKVVVGIAHRDAGHDHLVLRNFRDLAHDVGAQVAPPIISSMLRRRTSSSGLPVST